VTGTFERTQQWQKEQLSHMEQLLDETKLKRGRKTKEQWLIDSAISDFSATSKVRLSDQPLVSERMQKTAERGSARGPHSGMKNRL
jgi:hypothetical protein